MAHEPKLQVFKIYLNPKNTTADKSFRFLYKQKFSTTDDSDNALIFRELLNDISATVDSGYFLHEGKKKALGIEKTAGQPDSESQNNQSVKLMSDHSIIHGRLQGGKYGQDRSVGDITNAGSREPLKKENIVLDNYYFLIYTPLGSDKGIAMVHSYTDDTINDVFINWLREIFVSDGFYKPNTQPYSPKKIKEEFVENSFIKEFKYSKDILISEIDAIDSIRTKDWTVEVIIRAKEGGIEVSNLNKLADIFKGVIFKSKRKQFKLDEFNRKTALLNDGRHQNSFKIGSEIDIQPTIYLKEKISIGADGLPNWAELETFCYNLLQEIIPEVYPENEELS